MAAAYQPESGLKVVRHIGEYIARDEHALSLFQFHIDKSNQLLTYNSYSLTQ